MTSKKLDLKEIKEVALNMLIYVDDICQKNHLRYSIYYGTLLGAVRHQGFIPWDDDIDIVLPRPDYEKLLEILRDDPNYILASSLNKTSYRYTYSKLFDPKTKLVSKQILGYEDKEAGVFIDIFPLDGVPSSREEQKKYADELNLYKLGFIYTLGFLYARSYLHIRTIIKLLVKYPMHRKYKKKGNYEYWRNLYEESSLRYPFEKSDFCGHLEFLNHDKTIYPTDWFSKDNFERINFEGHKISAIKNTDLFLTKYYGDYMTLPPKEEQVSNHLYDFYWK
ncbi:LicD family protein [Enterococcus dongliensis]|uniref:LicD family protein n=1 Tax=Enterococcus dongliensis TaxID=2559925 RepID=UPI002890CECA|nr:LicD family protein [Enterococcus dongliensis]MDT2633450.1 LicD family protein [Enterococcus dongliensis]MDT2641328.1 LicD family protein [Enterococcus dongliensis]MDT2646548.1 LicD family protein [Enterococcus dongliensis]MDT2710545.1 LicD family protein [Enterococcus dongliensis]